MKTDSTSPAEIETHPFPPFLPHNAKALIMGTFPPGAHRWSMDFYYPNPQNDMWRIMGLIFLGNKDALYIPAEKRFDEQAIRTLMEDKGIAFSDTGSKARRLAGNASDKFLEIVEPVDLHFLLNALPQCRAIATTGAKAAGVIADLTGTTVPAMGEYVSVDGLPSIWRLPSTSRAYPLSLDKKAALYRRMLETAGIPVL